MSNRIDTLLGGLGKMDAVASAWIEHTNDNDHLREKIRAAWITVAQLGQVEGGDRAFYALACAILNIKIKSSGWYFVVDDNEKLRTNFLASDADRETMLSVIAD